ncbi:endonuclease/exonuclease/phosphatase family protein [Thalassotalea sp. LPB0316]|uniref:endonuclease/exonuclease/phosphatase family protein n=1 Tax=Thalassotalea sp. LPB0316 TaxID=2769490 RepID=UPI001868F9F6|nr:endonuclease/exonuclease/phosphatase family protein [Thalassotalea sp. LPB0316]QOL24828.1 endonuclease/exonuclease/phosphatase family protein [Thalassotalea sp. LPB0316]
MKRLTQLLAITAAITTSGCNAVEEQTTIRVATFNVSMEALNYMPYEKGKRPVPVGDELIKALSSNHQQIKNIAKIIQQTNPDIILLNEFDRNDEHHAKALALFKSQYLNSGQSAVNYPYSYQGPVNTGVPANVDMNANGKTDDNPADTFGFGYFPGHFGMALLSKYPIDKQHIRSFQKFKWKDMPGALKPIDPNTNTDYYDKQAWDVFRLSSKSHWDIPVNINGTKVHIIAAHPTPPVFDGPEDRNGKRNHDEIRLINDYITPTKASYLYDDNQQTGGLGANVRFVILGDLNASSVEGDAINSGIASLLANPQLQDPLPMSKGGDLYKPDNNNSKHHTAYWGMRADYVLPSTFGFKILDSGVFWPEQNSEQYYLIKDRGASSDHRLVWADLQIK